MTRLTVTAIPVIVGEFDLTIRDPGLVHHVAFERKKSLVMTAGTPDFEEVPVLFIEASPDAPARKHRFMVINHGDVFEPNDDATATWRATGMSATGAIVHVFEMRGAAS